MEKKYTDFTEYRKVQTARILSNYKETDELIKAYDEQKIEKSEGSRGGKVIGHTKSGKPIYANKEASTYTDFSSKDHKDAAELHNERMNHHDRMAQKYSDESKSSAEEASQQRLERHDVHRRNHETAAKESEEKSNNKSGLKKQRGGEDPGTDKNHPEHNPIVKSEKDQEDEKKAMDTSSTPGKETATKDGFIIKGEEVSDLQKAYQTLGLK